MPGLEWPLLGRVGTVVAGPTPLKNPCRERRFRSELPPHAYVTGYGIDDVIYEEAHTHTHTQRADTAILFKNKAVALTSGVD